MPISIISFRFRAFCLAIAALIFPGCDKPGSDANGSAEGVVTSQVEKAPATDMTQLAQQYGFAAMLNKNVEAFSSGYQLQKVWAAISNSKWANGVLSLKELKQNPEFMEMVSQWKSSMGGQIREKLESVLGTEVHLVMPHGFSEKLKPWIDAYQTMYWQMIQADLMEKAGGQASENSQEKLQQAIMAHLPTLLKCEIPPVVLVSKAVKSKKEIDEIFGGLAEGKLPLPPTAMEFGEFEVGPKHKFNFLHIKAKELLPPNIEETLQALLGDPVKARQSRARLAAKKVELSWGWVGDYFVIGLGPDHEHIKLAISPEKSALAIPEVLKHASEFASKKPISLSYASKEYQQAFVTKPDLMGGFDALSGFLSGTLKQEQLVKMREDVEKLNERVKEFAAMEFDPSVAVTYLENGIYFESRGGQRMGKMLDSSKALSFSRLADAHSGIFINAREAQGGVKLADLVEHTSTMVWNWYDTFGQQMVPEESRPQAQAFQMMAVPMAKQIWSALRNLGKALGSEAAFIIDLNGPMPKLPDAPPAIAGGKLPRIAFVAHLKDRAAASEAWKGFAKVMDDLRKLGGEAAPPVGESTMKKVGDTEVHSIPIPMPIPAEDVLPNVTITNDRWIVSTSSSFSQDLATKPSESGAAMGYHAAANFTSIWNFADGWLKIADQMVPPDKAAEYQANRPLLGSLLELARSMVSAELKISETAGKMHMSGHLKLQDIP